jgi:hypothetical protein
VRTTGQSASSAGRIRKEFGERRRQRLGGQSAMQGRKLWLKPREENPALSEGFLPWTRRQLSEAGKGPVMVSRGQSMRRRLLLVGESGAKS